MSDDRKVEFLVRRRLGRSDQNRWKNGVERTLMDTCGYLGILQTWLKAGPGKGVVRGSKLVARTEAFLLSAIPAYN